MLYWLLLDFHNSKHIYVCSVKFNFWNSYSVFQLVPVLHVRVFDLAVMMTIVPWHHGIAAGGCSWGDWGDLVTGGDAVIGGVVHVSDGRANGIGQLELTHQLLQQLHSLISAQVNHDSFHLKRNTRGTVRNMTQHTGRRQIRDGKIMWLT